jgi:hypothetical protein
MHVQRLLGVASMFALAACASPPSEFEAAYSAHASRYTDELTEATRDYEGGSITDADMSARIRAAGETLTAADAATAREENRALAANAQRAPPGQVVATPVESSGPEPVAEKHDSCFLIPCGPAAPAPANVSPAAPAPPPAPPTDDHNLCLLIRCD